MIFKVLNQFLGLLYALFFKISWFKFIKLYDKKATNIVWICPVFPERALEYLVRTTFISDLATIQALIENNQHFRLLLGRKKIGKQNNSKIYYSVSYHFNFFHLTNYAAGLQFVVTELEKQGNILFPNSKEVLYWENKAYMHQKFDELGINSPKTMIVEANNTSNNNFLGIEYPVLWKDVHSAGALGIYKLNNQEAFLTLFQAKKKQGISTFLLQKLINMRKDFRVTIIGNEIYHHYWRVNASEDWKPTSTSHGSSVDFITFPEQWRNYILEQFKKLQINTGAFDITWENDDINTTPIFLEVSPSYDTNPPQPEDLKEISYKAYKKKLFHRDAYFKGRVNYIFDIKSKLYQIYNKNA